MVFGPQVPFLPQAIPTEIPILPIPDLPSAPATTLIGKLSNATGTSTAPATGTANAEVTGSQLLDATVQPNAFNAFYGVTPHFRLFMAGDNDLGTNNSMTTNQIYEELSKRPQVTIAETGVTTYNIKDVEIEMFCGPNVETRNVSANRFRITITEPMGVGFLDAFQDAAEALVIRNPQKSIYYLELTFSAYDDQGNIQTQLLKEMIAENSARWVWQLAIVNVDVQLNAGGGEYRLDAYPYGEGAWDDDILRSPETFVIAGATIRDATNTYMDRLTEYRHLAYGGNNVVFKPPVFHALEGRGKYAGIDPGSFKLKPRDALAAPMRGGTMASELAEPLATVNQGASAADFFDFVFANTEEAQQLALDRNGVQDSPNATDANSNSSKFRQVFIIRIEPDIKVIDYDHVSEVYVREVTLHIHPYYTQAPVTSPEQARDAESPEVQAAMMGALLANNFIAKRYEYIFTGLNTEVTKFDISFNFAWGAMISPNDGTSGDTVQPSAVTPPSGKASSIDGNAMAQAQTLQELQVLNTQIAIDDSVRQDSNQRLNSEMATLANAQAQFAATGDQKYLTQINTSNANIAAGKEGLTSFADAANQRRAQANQKYSLLNPTPASQVTGVQFAEVIFAKKTATKETIVPHRISFKQAHRLSTDTTGTGLPSTNHRDKSIFGTVLGQLYAPMAKQFMSIDLEIRADPYWLGQTNLMRQSYLRTAASAASTATASTAKPTTAQGIAQQALGKLPDWQRGDQIFVMQFRYPLGLGDDLKPIFRQEETFVGLYRVHNVTHHFSEGVYKQTLKGFRLPLHSLKQALSTPTVNQPPTVTSPVVTPAAPPRNPATVPPIPAKGLADPSGNVNPISSADGLSTAI